VLGRLRRADMGIGTLGLDQVNDRLARGTGGSAEAIDLLGCRAQFNGVTGAFVSIRARESSQHDVAHSASPPCLGTVASRLT